MLTPQQLAAQLQQIPSYPWESVQTWAMPHTALIRQLNPQKFPRFVELMQEPEWPEANVAHVSVTREQMAQLINAVNQQRIALYKPICEARKSEIVAFLKSL